MQERRKWWRPSSHASSRCASVVLLICFDYCMSTKYNGGCTGPPYRGSSQFYHLQSKASRHSKYKLNDKNHQQHVRADGVCIFPLFNFSVNDEVFGFSAAGGCFAEYLTIKKTAVVTKCGAIPANEAPGYMHRVLHCLRVAHGERQSVQASRSDDLHCWWCRLSLPLRGAARQATWPEGD